ncbi:Serine/threonine-protein kinase mTOR [Scomber scombrus]|uniref:Serine/threonine-protein kinase mTOR n=1 Tax=Scomber scombrus TaxID=13677 RepID=A0AAV1N786_SCOSC
MLAYRRGDKVTRSSFQAINVTSKPCPDDIDELCRLCSPVCPKFTRFQVAAEDWKASRLLTSGLNIFLFSADNGVLLTSSNCDLDIEIEFLCDRGSFSILSDLRSSDDTSTVTVTFLLVTAIFGDNSGLLHLAS